RKANRELIPSLPLRPRRQDRAFFSIGSQGQLFYPPFGGICGLSSVGTPVIGYERNNQQSADVRFDQFDGGPLRGNPARRANLSTRRPVCVYEQNQKRVSRRRRPSRAGLPPPSGAAGPLTPHSR